MTDELKNIESFLASQWGLFRSGNNEQWALMVDKIQGAILLAIWLEVSKEGQALLLDGQKQARARQMFAQSEINL